MAMAVLLTACASTPSAGPLGEGAARTPMITALDSSRPPKFLWAQLDEAAYTVVLLVAPGHSATLLYPRDSVIDNRLSAGAHLLTFEIPGTLVRTDSATLAERARARARADSIRAGARVRQRASLDPPIDPMTPTFLLLVTSSQPLTYARILEKTAGVSIPNLEMEALNAVGKAVKSTIADEPRDWAGYYRRVELSRRS